MLNLEEDKLKLLLEKRRKMLERAKYSALGEIVSGISLMITLCLADFSLITFTKPLYFKIATWGIAIIIFAYGIYTFICSVVSFYSVDSLYSEIANIDPRTEHKFNIVVCRDIPRSGKYLVFKSKRWGCWLFPNYHCAGDAFVKEEETKHVRNCLKRDLCVLGKIKIRYLGDDISEKYSVGDKIMKRYHFYFFQIENCIINNKKRSFRYGGKIYRWKSIDQMYASKNIKKKNADVLDFIRKTCDMS